ncbi:hypothetical protein DH2020_028322 [Rehmannia glutinosa]|uniref:Aminotransferase-like plant mobile domain-containing protein n=1 Tax=Rehmannia glutinosa TaxID=99300 RepID=A0ABR0VSN8_REHGL
MSGFTTNSGRRIIEGKAKWGDPIQFGGEFHYVKGYWEWTKISLVDARINSARPYIRFCVCFLFTYDCNSNIARAFCEAWCPSTNTLLTSHGELSISLWDLHTLDGLPMTGFLYDEVVRSAKELTGVDEAGLRFLPRSCKRLLHAYHILQGSAHGDHYSQVSIDDWINFWFKKATKYNPPLVCKEKKALLWQGTNDPKMAIFSGEGHGKYYEPKEARRRIHKGDWISWTCTLITKSKDFHYVDNGNAQRFEQDYFIVIRSSYLSLRQGGRFVIEPYSSLRFSRQFGFYQMVSGVLKEEVRGASLEVYHWRVCTSSKTFSKVWLPCMPPNAKIFSSEEYKRWWARIHGNYFEENIENLINSKPNKVLPKDERPRRGPLGVEVCESNKRKVVIHSFEENSSSDADHHWKRLKKTHKSLEKQEANGVASNQPLTENFVEELEKQLLDNECEHGSQDSQRSIMGPNLPTVNHQKVTSNSIEAKTSPCVVFSVFQGEKFIRNHQQEYFQKLRGDFREKISNIPIDSLSSIQDEVMIVLKSMKSFNIIDISFVEGSLKDLFTKAIAYDEARSSSSEIVSKELLAQQLSKVEDRLHDAKTKEVKEPARISSTKEELESINRELDNLRKRKKNLTASLNRQEEFLHIAHTEVQQIEDEIVAIQTILPSNDKVLGKVGAFDGASRGCQGRIEELASFRLVFFFFFFYFILFEKNYLLCEKFKTYTYMDSYSFNR